MDATLDALAVQAQAAALPVQAAARQRVVLPPQLVVLLGQPAELLGYRVVALPENFLVVSAECLVVVQRVDFLSQRVEQQDLATAAALACAVAAAAVVATRVESAATSGATFTKSTRVHAAVPCLAMQLVASFHSLIKLLVHWLAASSAVYKRPVVMPAAPLPRCNRSPPADFVALVVAMAVATEALELVSHLVAVHSVIAVAH